MAYRLLTAAAALCLLGGVAQAQTYTTMSLAPDMLVTTGPSGSYTTMPLAPDMSVTTGPGGYHSTTMSLGGGIYSTTVTGGTPALAPAFQMPRFGQ